MIKKLFGRIRQNREILKCRASIHFSRDDVVSPHLAWLKSQDPGRDTVKFIIYYYARILFELAELNETRVANELIDFIKRIAGRLASNGSAGKLQIPLGKLRFSMEPGEPAKRVYEALFFEKQHGRHRLEFTNVIGKENFFLPASLLACLQLAINILTVEQLAFLATSLERLHQYYRYRRDYWEGTSLVEGPSFALGHETIPEASADKG